MKKIFIISDIGHNVGLGHFSRSKFLTNEINSFFGKKIKIYNFYFSKKGICFNKIKSIKIINLHNYILRKINKISPDIVIFNVSRFLEPKLHEFAKLLKTHYNLKLIAIDGFIKKSEFFEKIWIPNVTLKYKKDFINRKILYGWNKILIDNSKIKKKKNKKIKILFILGGTDKYKIGKYLPKLVEKKFDQNVNFLWIKGPYASKPKIYNKKKWVIVKNKFNLKSIYKDIDVAFVVFGVSFFEIVYQGIPNVLFFHKKKTVDFHLINFLKKKKFDITSSLNKAVNILHSKIKFLKKSNVAAERFSKYINFNNRKKFLREMLL